MHWLRVTCRRARARMTHLNNGGTPPHRIHGGIIHTCAKRGVHNEKNKLSTARGGQGPQPLQGPRAPGSPAPLSAWPRAGSEAGQAAEGREVNCPKPPHHIASLFLGSGQRFVVSWNPRRMTCCLPLSPAMHVGGGWAEWEGEGGTGGGRLCRLEEGGNAGGLGRPGRAHRRRLPPGEQLSGPEGRGFGDHRA